MDNARLIAQYESMIRQAWERKDKETIVRLSLTLSGLRNDRIKELEKEKAVNTLTKRYKYE